MSISLLRDKTQLALVNVVKSAQISSHDRRNVVVRGSVEGQDPFLMISWEDPRHDDAGRYECHILGLDLKGTGIVRFAPNISVTAIGSELSDNPVDVKPRINVRAIDGLDSPVHVNPTFNKVAVGDGLFPSAIISDNYGEGIGQSSNLAQSFNTNDRFSGQAGNTYDREKSWMNRCTASYGRRLWNEDCTPVIPKGQFLSAIPGFNMHEHRFCCFLKKLSMSEMKK